MAGYHNWMDTASLMLFDIQHAEVDMGEYTIRFWKGDYGTIMRYLASSFTPTFALSLFIGMAGGETGAYNNDGHGLGNNGGSLMSWDELSSLGIINVRLNVKNQGGISIASVEGKRAWPNVYHMLNHSKKWNLYTETIYSFNNEKQAESFANKFIEQKNKTEYDTQLNVTQNGKDVIIIWGGAGI